MNNVDVSSGGNGGGPWYAGDIALGTMSCEASVSGHGYIDGIYMAANYIESGLDVTIKTSF